MLLQKYIEDVQKQFKTGIAREHAYRPALKNLIEDLIPEITAINDPAHIKCGAPDFILHKRKLEVGYIEAKDVGIDLSKTEKTDQLQRYLEALDNLILTDYLEFRFYLRSEKVEVVRIAEIENGEIKPLPDNYEHLKTLLIDFAAFQGQTIKSARNLATMMAHKARLMRDVFYNVVTDEEPSSLKDQLKAFQNVLMHDMDEAQFADVYAQTIAYGLFTARLHDKTKDDFSRSEALLLIPKSNPFLRQLFSYIAGAELDERVIWIVDGLCEVFLFSDLDKILADFGSSTGQNDPMLHFYETFLTEYDKDLKEKCGVWYTPEPVVNFIVRAIDDVLQIHFNLKDGIADKSKITIEVEDQAFDKRTRTGFAKKKMDVHKVQLLDVATGTGTFLAESLKQIYKKYKGQEGIWSSYVENDLLPRIHGFELLMASYAMCHMKLDLLLQETGYKPINTSNPPRLSVYLSNSLEEHHPDTDTLFASWLSREANEASRIKKDTPVMIAFGNPPYNGKSPNKGKWIMGLMEDYKREPSGEKLKEKNSKWINNDYAKFIRMGEHFIKKNGTGILAYITSNSYLDGQIFRGMRHHLLKTFDDIYIVDLHGNADKRETTPAGCPDFNVFDIMEGVSIIIAARYSNSTRHLANLYHCDLWGTRKEKYDFLFENKLSSMNFQKLNYREPHYFFVPKNFKGQEDYFEGFCINDFFKSSSMGVTTGKDKERVSFSKIDSELLKRYSYRPFDIRNIIYDTQNLARSRETVMRNFYKANVALISCKRNRDDNSTFFVSNQITDKSIISSLDNSYCFPLYLYQNDMGEEQKVPNFSPEIYNKIKSTIPNVTPEGLFDYVYAVLHSSIYRERYAEFLKIDFPRIPYPDNSAICKTLAKKGAELRGLHLMESGTLDDLITTYPEAGNNEVQAIGRNSYRDGNVYINDNQYFGGVSEIAWNFYIGGYQPAQKWLKDRKGRTLGVDDIMHYQRMIVALVNTDRIMKEIDEIKFLPEKEQAEE